MLFDSISGGLELLFQPRSLLWLFAGLVLGFVVGVLPGLSTSNTAALLLPFSIGLPIGESVILIVSIYAGAQFGGAIPAILINVPGESGAAVTALDGYPLGKKGKAGLAIGIARMASVLGGVLSGLVILLVLGPLGDFALNFGAREMFVVILLGFVVAATLVGDTPRKGLMAGALGLLLATIGAAPQTGQDRFSFGVLAIYEGIPFVPVLIGVFAISEMLLVARNIRREKILRAHLEGGVRDQLRDAVEGVRVTVRHPGTVAQSSAIGVFMGVIPGVGTAVNFVCYAFAKRRSKTPEEFGRGAPEGIIASEAGDNATTSAALVPTLTLGIPGSATMAVILAAFYLQGIQPGPRVLQTHGAEAYGAVLALILASILILPLGVVLAGPLTLITRVPKTYLVPAVIFISLAGSFAVRYSLFDVGLAVAFGVIGLLMKLNGFPVIPLVLGFILGPLAEENLIRGLALAQDEISYFFGSATVLVLWGLLCLLVVYLIASALRDRRNAGRAPADGAASPTGDGDAGTADVDGPVDAEIDEHPSQQVHGRRPR